MIEDLKQMAGAAPILAEWFGEGGEPVPRQLAADRANICRCIHDFESCENNTAANWWQTHLSDPIAQVITTMLEFKNKTDIHLPDYVETDLGMCKICGCCLKLKVWTPIKHIANHTSIEQLAQYPSFCWIKRETLTPMKY